MIAAEFGCEWEWSMRWALVAIAMLGMVAQAHAAINDYLR